MKYFLFIFAICVTGCAHQARTFKAPDKARLGAASDRLGARVTEARASARRASAAVASASASTARETARIEAIAPRVENLLRIVPPELRPEVETLHGDVTALQMAHAETLASLARAKGEQGTLAAQLEEANAAKEEVAKYGPEYVAAVEKQTVELNAAQAGWARDSAEIVKLRTGSFLFKVAAGMGLIGLAGLAFLYFTGRLALAGASIAAKI